MFLMKTVCLNILCLLHIYIMITTNQLFFTTHLQSLLIFVSLCLKQPKLPNFSNTLECESPYTNRKHKQWLKEDDDERSYVKIESALSSDTQDRILIVDDEPDITRLFKLILEQNGFAVDALNNPLSVLSNYKVGMYSLLLLDVKMPNMNGFELYKNIKNIDDITPVCFITAYEEYISEFKRLFPKLETDCFIKKPIEVQSLVKIVRSRLGSS